LEDEEAALEDEINNEDDDDEDENRHKRHRAKEAESLEAQAVSKSNYVTRWNFDDENGSWCEIDMRFPAGTKKILMVNLVETSCEKVIVHQIPGIQRCFEYINPTENDTSVS
jgi:DNA-directed RNA polymerase I subunit RPA1